MRRTCSAPLVLPPISALALLISAVALAGCGGGKKAAKTARTSSAPSQTSSAPTSPTGTATGPTGVAPAPSREVSPGVVRASSGGVSATMHASSHHPRVNRPWPVSFDVSKAGRRVKAEVRYEYLFAGQVVARRSHYRFDGSFHDTFIWPDSAIGYPLTFRAMITASGTTLNLDYQVQVAR